MSSLEIYSTVHSIENRSRISAVRASEGDGGREIGRCSSAKRALETGVEGRTSEVDRSRAEAGEEMEEEDVTAPAERGGVVPTDTGETGPEDDGVGSFQRCTETRLSLVEL